MNIPNTHSSSTSLCIHTPPRKQHQGEMSGMQMTCKNQKLWYLKHWDKRFENEALLESTLLICRWSGLEIEEAFPLSVSLSLTNPISQARSFFCSFFFFRVNPANPSKHDKWRNSSFYDHSLTLMSFQTYSVMFSVKYLSIHFFFAFLYVQHAVDCVKINGECIGLFLVQASYGLLLLCFCYFFCHRMVRVA